MSAIRACGLLGCVLLAGSAVLPSPWTHGSAAAEDDHRTPPSVQFDSILVNNPVFSPNQDPENLKETTTFRYFLNVAGADSIAQLVFVTRAGSVDTLRKLQNAVDRSPVTFYTLSWDGTDFDGVVQPEGVYTVHFMVTVYRKTPPTEEVLQSQRQVRIDVTAPVVEITDVVPQRFTPTLPGNENVVPEVRLRVTQSELEDIVVVELARADVVLDTMQVAGDFSGDGDYLVLCASCADEEQGDGVYVLTARATDAGANVTTAVDSLDKNVEGPDIVLTHPTGLLVFQAADSLVGTASDRHVVDAVEMQIVAASAPDTTLVALPPRGGMSDTSVGFFADLSGLLSADDDYEILLRGRDSDGVSDSTSVTITVDTTAPGAPRLVPPLPATTGSQTLQGTAVFDDDDVVGLRVSGGAEPSETLLVTGSERSFSRALEPGANTLRFEAVDRAQNVSAARVVQVTWRTSLGITAPERFQEVNERIEVDVGDTAAEDVTIRILALDGSLVREFRNTRNELIYIFPWDLRTPEGREVKNGAYLLHVLVRYPGGSTSTFRKMIAVVR